MSIIVFVCMRMIHCYPCVYVTFVFTDVNCYVTYHCVKSVRIRCFFRPYFHAFGLNKERYEVLLFAHSSKQLCHARKLMHAKITFFSKKDLITSFSNFARNATNIKILFKFYNSSNNGFFYNLFQSFGNMWHVP